MMFMRSKQWRIQDFLKRDGRKFLDAAPGLKKSLNGNGGGEHIFFSLKIFAVIYKIV